MKYLLGISYFGASIFLLVSIFFDWGGGFCPESFWFFSKIFVLIAAFCAFANGVFAFRGSNFQAESDKEMLKLMLGVFVFVLLWHFFIVFIGHPLTEVSFHLLEQIDIIFGVIYCLLALVGLSIISWFTAK